MDLISQLPAAPQALLEQEEGRLLLALSDGLAVLADGDVDYVVRESVDRAARGPDGRIYFSREDQILCVDIDRGEPEEITAAFAGKPNGTRLVYLYARR